jgi:hypothetical protein
VHAARCADLLAGAGASSDDELGGASGDESSEGDDSQGAGADLADLDYDAMLAAGTGQGRRGNDSEDDSLGAGSEDDDDDIDELASDEEEGGAGGAGRAQRAQRGRRAAFEDDFLKLDDLEAFLDQAEAEEGKEGEPAAVSRGVVYLQGF